MYTYTGVVKHRSDIKNAYLFCSVSICGTTTTIFIYIYYSHAHTHTHTLMTHITHQVIVFVLLMKTFTSSLLSLSTSLSCTHTHHVCEYRLLNICKISFTDYSGIISCIYLFICLLYMYIYSYI
eukprot:GHVR01176107.1.p1 GENE.GHVR01176107.1~~GHVR01176107.1.p1  ORF type:complete len:124 (-),score=25.28 GHVR01176107.1:747-1118(-)